VLTVIDRTTIDADWLVVVRRPMRQRIQRVTRMLAWCPEDGELMKSTQKASHQWREPQGRPRWHLAGRLTFTQSLQVDLLEPHGRFESADAWQAALDAWHHR
jgi:hypothetical protein